MTEDPVTAHPAPASTTRQETAGQVETSNDNLVPPGQITHEHILYDAESQVEALASFLAEHFPGEVALTNRQVPEAPVETAMRLLMGRQARADAPTTRCPEMFCNKAVGHSDVHGWVHYD